MFARFRSFPRSAPSGVALSGALALAILAILAGCRGVSVASEVRVAFDPANYETFSFVASEAVHADEVDAVLRAAVERELGALGIAHDATGAADLVVTYETAVESRQHDKDPYFAFHAAELIEYGTLTVRLVDLARAQTLWRGSGTSELRVAAVPLGPLAASFTPTDEPREWRVEEKVSKMFRGLREDLGLATAR